MDRAHHLAACLFIALLLCGAGCTRNTPGFCDSNTAAGTPCADPAQICLLPAHQCIASTFRGALSGSQQVPPTASDGDGLFKMVLSADRTRFTCVLTHTVAGATGADIHMGKSGTGGGPVVFHLNKLDGTGENLAIGSDQLIDLAAENYYVEIDSATFPRGEVRSQIWVVDQAGESPLQLSGLLTGAQENPTISSAGNGRVKITLNEGTGEIGYTIAIDQAPASPVVGIHIHRGGQTVNGPHIVNLPTSPDKMLTGKLMKSDILPGQEADYLYVIKGGLSYLNYHTQDNAGGELRAQLLRTAALPFSAPLSSKNGAQGYVHLFMDAPAAHLAFRLDHQVPGVLSAAILKGQGGPVVADLGSGKNRSQGILDITTSGAGGLVIADLQAGSLYVVVRAGNGDAGVGDPGPDDLVGQLQVPQAPPL